MEEFQTYAPEDVILENLEELVGRAALHREQEAAHLRELANEIAAEFSDGYAFLSSLSEHRLPTPKAEGDLSRSEAWESTVLQAESTRMRALLCMELCRRLPPENNLIQEFLFPSDERIDPAALNRISYQKNGYTDRAYEQFSVLLTNPRAAYAHSFPSVCEDVYNGICEYCILPLENSAEGRLQSFSRLISQYDLKIAATCEVQTGEERSTRYALLRRNAILLSREEDLPKFFELNCQTAQFPACEDLLSVARFCGLTALRVEYAALGASADDKRLNAVFSTDKGNLRAFLLYLAMEFPTASPVGLYPHLSNEKKRG